MTRRLNLNSRIVNKELKNQFDYSLNVDSNVVPIAIQENANRFLLPYYNYMSEWKEFGLNFVYPSGYKLLIFTLDSVEKDKNMSVFVFTNAKLNTRFNYYDISQ